jgi:hypothetical protein
MVYQEDLLDSSSSREVFVFQERLTTNEVFLQQAIGL